MKKFQAIVSSDCVSGTQDIEETLQKAGFTIVHLNSDTPPEDFSTNEGFWVVKPSGGKSKLVDAMYDYLIKKPQRALILVLPRNPEVPEWARRFSEFKYFACFGGQETGEEFVSFVDLYTKLLLNKRL